MKTKNSEVNSEVEKSYLTLNKKIKGSLFIIEIIAF